MNSLVGMGFLVLGLGLFVGFALFLQSKGII